MTLPVDQNPDGFVLYFYDDEPAPEVLTDEDAIAILSEPQGDVLDSDQVNALLNSLVAAGDMHTGAMIALRPSVDDIERLAAFADEPAEELHLTILYLGESALIDAFKQDAIIGEVAKFAKMKRVKANGNGVLIFNPKGDDSCIVLQVGDSHEIVGMRDSLFNSIRYILGDALPAQFVPFIPHVTLSYDEDASRIPQLTHLTGPITFDAIRVAFGGEIIDIEFEDEGTDD